MTSNIQSAPRKVHPANNVVQKMVDEVTHLVLRRINNSGPICLECTDTGFLEAKSYASRQDENGVNFYIKVKAGVNNYLHLDIHKPISPKDDKIVLTRIHSNMTYGDPLRIPAKSRTTPNDVGKLFGVMRLQGKSRSVGSSRSRSSRSRSERPTKSNPVRPKPPVDPDSPLMVDVFIGQWNPKYWKTDKDIRDIARYCLRAPRLMVTQKTYSRDSELLALQDRERCRMLMLDLPKMMFEDVYGKDKSLASNSEQLICLGNLALEIKKAIAKAESIYQPARTVFLLRGEDLNFDAICAFACVQKKIGMFVLNDVGKELWESQSGDEKKLALFKYRLRKIIDKYHPVLTNTDGVSSEPISSSTKTSL